MSRFAPGLHVRSDACDGHRTAGSVRLRSLRLGANQPVGKLCWSDQTFAIGNECTFGYLTSEVAQARVGHDIAWVMSRLQKLSCQIVELPLFRSSDIDIAV